MIFQPPTRDFMKAPGSSRPPRRVKPESKNGHVLERRLDEDDDSTAARRAAAHGRGVRGGPRAPPPSHERGALQPIGGMMRTGGGEPTAPGASSQRGGCPIDETRQPRVSSIARSRLGLPSQTRVTVTHTSVPSPISMRGGAPEVYTRGVVVRPVEGVVAVQSVNA